MASFRDRHRTGADPAAGLPNGAQALEQAERASEQGRQRVGDKLPPTEITCRRRQELPDRAGDAQQVVDAIVAVEAFHELVKTK